eukprot:9361688-Pyramimonas_sp.AAC.1
MREVEVEVTAEEADNFILEEEVLTDPVDIEFWKQYWGPESIRDTTPIPESWIQDIRQEAMDEKNMEEPWTEEEIFRA